MHKVLMQMAICIVVLANGWMQAQSSALQDGDRIVFYGDSITAQRLYTRYVADFYRTRYPALHLSFWNAGVPGDTAYGGYADDRATRVRRDVAAHQPTVISVMLGMNDGGYVPFEQRILDIYKSGYAALLDDLHATVPAARVTLITPTPYDEITHGTQFPGYSNVVGRNAEFVRSLSTTKKLPMADAFTAFQQVLTLADTREPKLATLLVPDRIHPGDAAHWIIAAQLAAAWHIDPVVSSVELKANGDIGKIARSKVTEVHTIDNGLAWTQLDEALPLPLDKNNVLLNIVIAAPQNGFDLMSLDRQMLQVRGLKEGRYVLSIDGKRITEFSSQQLDAGVNLALEDTPMLQQANGIDFYMQRRIKLEEAAFILEAETKAAGKPEAIHSLASGEAELQQMIETHVLPTPHTFTLSLAPNP